MTTSSSSIFSGGLANGSEVSSRVGFSNFLIARTSVAIRLHHGGIKTAKDAIYDTGFQLHNVFE